MPKGTGSGCAAWMTLGEKGTVGESEAEGSHTVMALSPRVKDTHCSA